MAAESGTGPEERVSDRHSASEVRPAGVLTLLRPMLDPSGYDLGSVMDAHARIGSRSAAGKVVVTVST